MTANVPHVNETIAVFHRIIVLYCTENLLNCTYSAHQMIKCVIVCLLHTKLVIMQLVVTVIWEKSCIVMVPLWIVFV